MMWCLMTRTMTTIKLQVPATFYVVLSRNHSLSLKHMAMVMIKSQVPEQVAINLENVGGDKAYAIKS